MFRRTSARNVRQLGIILKKALQGGNNSKKRVTYSSPIIELFIVLWTKYKGLKIGDFEKILECIGVKFPTKLIEIKKDDNSIEFIPTSNDGITIKFCLKGDECIYVSEGEETNVYIVKDGDPKATISERIIKKMG